jgi:hypothetical protein
MYFGPAPPFRAVEASARRKAKRRLFHHQRAAMHIISADISDQRSQPLQGVRVCRE